MKIKIIDSIMGAGKSSFMMEHINYDTINSYVYVTPYIDEVKRVKETCDSKNFIEPKVNEELHILSKSKSLKCLLKYSRNIVTTHSLFKLIDEETEQILENSNYTLVIDEVLDVLQQIPLSKADIDILFEKSQLLKVNEETNLIELGDGAEEYMKYTKEDDKVKGKFSELLHMAKLKRMFRFEDKIILWEFPYEVFKSFKEVWILTYLFDSSIQKHFFDFYDIKYEKYSVVHLPEFNVEQTKYNSNNYNLVPYNPELERDKITEIKNRIEIYEGHLNDIGNQVTAFSFNWYKSCKNLLKEKIELNTYNYLRHICKAKSNDVIWTSFKEKLNIHSYKKAFIPHNLRATNEYSNTHTVVYLINRYISPFIDKYFKTKGIILNQNIHALSDMLQMIFRSRIRNGENIKLYVPSLRMRTLLQKYLNNELIEHNLKNMDNIAEE